MKKNFVKRLFQRLSYANVMSTIAVFLLLGGATAFAALGKHSVGAGQLKKNAVTAAKIRKNAVTTAKIKNHAVTAAKLDLSGLGSVPSAGTAQTAADARTVNGQALIKVFDSVAAGQTKDVAAVAGFTVRASCESSNVDVLLTSSAATGATLVAEGDGKEEGSVFEYESTAPGTAAAIRLDGHAGRDNRYGETSFSASTPGGTVVSGDIAYDFNSFGETQPGTCIVFGEVASG